MDEFIYGCCGGVFGTFLSHPVDTIRINLQSKRIPEYSCRALYKGILPPFFGIGLEKAVVFGTYNLLKDYGTLVAGAGAGLASTFVVTPVEYFKILYQNGERIRLRQLRFRNIFRGWTATLLREFPGYAIYFKTYEILTNHFGKNPYSIFFSGGTAGITAWAFIYPADYIKTRMQFYQTSFGKTAQEIIRQEGVKGMYKGCCLALTRAFILHCGVFSGYEFAKQMFGDK